MESRTVLRNKAIPLLMVALGLAGTSAAQRIVEIPATEEQVAVTYQEIPDFDVETIQSEIRRRVNGIRSSAGLQVVKADSALQGIARVHSADMANSGYFGHINLRGENATRRAHRSGYVCVGSLAHPVARGLGENLFTGFLYESYRLLSGGGQIIAEFEWTTEAEIARRVVDGWMASPGHRRNLINPEYELQGIGVVITDAYEFFVTQTLC
ncbi:MAG: CAP domain-containing protein [Rhodothermia bacterium]|nr:CAP domain-containing protein [Rhodothermia bacterium]